VVGSTGSIRKCIWYSIPGVIDGKPVDRRTEQYASMVRVHRVQMRPLQSLRGHPYRDHPMTTNPDHYLCAHALRRCDDLPQVQVTAICEYASNHQTNQRQYEPVKYSRAKWCENAAPAFERPPVWRSGARPRGISSSIVDETHRHACPGPRIPDAVKCKRRAHPMANTRENLHLVMINPKLSNHWATDPVMPAMV